MARVEYGAGSTFVDVSHVYHAAVSSKGPVFVPPSDFQRAKLFRVDPVPGTVKAVIVSLDTEVVVLPAGRPLLLLWSDDDGGYSVHTGAAGMQHAEAVLGTIHASLSFVSAGYGPDVGGLGAELPEQHMIVGFVRPNARVLELGANVGRSTCALASLLNDCSTQLTSIECDAHIASGLALNCHRNNLAVRVVPAALSAHALEQQEWNCRPIGPAGVTPGWRAVKTVTLSQLLADVTAAPHGQQLPFDTVVADCEGALFSILQSFPELLSSVDTVVLENDFACGEDKAFVDAQFVAHGLARVYVQAQRSLFVQQRFPSCWERFFEVWQRGAAEQPAAPVPVSVPLEDSAVAKDAKAEETASSYDSPLWQLARLVQHAPRLKAGSSDTYVIDNIDPLAAPETEQCFAAVAAALALDMTWVDNRQTTGRFNDVVAQFVAK